MVVFAKASTSMTPLFVTPNFQENNLLLLGNFRHCSSAYDLTRNYRNGSGRVVIVWQGVCVGNALAKSKCKPEYLKFLPRITKKNLYCWTTSFKIS